MNPNTDNPLFEDRKELLERQSQEYKNALMGEVHELRHKSEEVGKKVLIAGGALVLTYALVKALRSRNGSHQSQQKLLVYKGKKGKKKKEKDTYALFEDLSNPSAAHAFDVSDAHYSDIAERPQPSAPVAAPQAATPEKNEQKDSLAKDIVGIVGRHLTAYLIILATRKIDEYLNARNSDPDTAPTPVSGTYAHGYGGEPTYTSAAASDIQSAAAE